MDGYLSNQFLHRYILVLLPCEVIYQNWMCSGPVLERKSVRMSNAWREKKFFKNIENSRNCLKLSKTPLLGGLGGERGGWGGLTLEKCPFFNFKYPFDILPYRNLIFSFSIKMIC